MGDEKSVNDIAKEAFLKGLKKGGLGALNKRVVQFVINQLGDKCPEMLKTEAGKSALEIAWPYVLLQLLSIEAVRSRIGEDRALWMEEILGLIMEDAFQRGTQKALDAAIETIMPFFQDLEQIAAELPDFESEGLSVVNSVEGVQEKEREVSRVG